MRCLNYSSTPPYHECNMEALPGTARCERHTIKRIEHELSPDAKSPHPPTTGVVHDSDRQIMNVKPVVDPALQTEGVKYDADKIPLHLLPVVPLETIAQVLQHGAKKYAPRNWEKGTAWSRWYGAILRHLFAFWRGEDNDPDSGLPHLAHAGCGVLYLLEYQRTHKELDDRPR